MPIYAYKCTACGHAQDVLQKMSDKRLTVCPECHQETYVKQVTAAGFQLKGSGWYVTDFRKDSGGAKTSESAVGGNAAQSAGAAGADKGAASSSEPSSGATSGSSAAASTASGNASSAASSNTSSSSSSSGSASAASSKPASSSGSAT